MVLRVGLLMALLVTFKRRLNKFFVQLMLGLFIYGLMHLAWQQFRNDLFFIVSIYISVSLADDLYKMFQEDVSRICEKKD